MHQQTSVVVMCIPGKRFLRLYRTPSSRSWEGGKSAAYTTYVRTPLETLQQVAKTMIATLGRAGPGHDVTAKYVVVRLIREFLVHLTSI